MVTEEQEQGQGQKLTNWQTLGAIMGLTNPSPKRVADLLGTSRAEIESLEEERWIELCWRAMNLNGSRLAKSISSELKYVLLRNTEGCSLLLNATHIVSALSDGSSTGVLIGARGGGMIHYVHETPEEIFQMIKGDVE